MKRAVATGIIGLAIALVVWHLAARSARSASVRGPQSGALARRAADPRHAARASVAGRVTSGGKPVAGAHVCADARVTAVLALLARDAICTESDANGTYTLGELFASEYRVSANARGKRPAASPYTRLVAGERASLDLQLADGGVELTGLVADIGGGPISHAQLRSGSAVAETDDQGAFSIWVDPGEASLDASADGYAATSWSGEAPDHVELRLQPESSLSGTVIGPDGQPVAGAHVEISGADVGMPTLDLDSADDGTFAADRIPGGRYAITVRAPHAYGTSAGTILVALAERSSGVVITLSPALQITGHITRDDGALCNDGWVHFVDDDHARTLDAYSGDDGTVELDGVLPGTYRATASCPDYMSSEASEIEVRDRDVIDRQWRVERGATLHGRVTLGDGTPIEGANVVLEGGATSVVTTAADGTYRATALAPGTYAVSASSLRATPSGRQDVEVGRRETVEHDLVLEPAATVRGVVVDARGAGVAGAHVRIRDTSLGAHTAHDGSFVIGSVPEGSHDLGVTLDDRALAPPGSEDELTEAITAVAGQTVTVRLLVAVAAARIRGVVVDSSGAPARDVLVELSAGGDAYTPPVLTRDDGTFELPAMQGARYKVHAYATGRGDAYVDADPDSDVPLQIQLATASFSGVVRGAPDELTITIVGDSYRTETFFHTGGRFALHDVHPGSYRVTFETESGHFENWYDVSAGDNEPLDIELDPVFTAHGRVVRGDTHAPVASATVEMREGMQSLTSDGGADAAGRFSIRRAHKGNARLLIGDADSRTWQNIEIEGPELPDVVLPAADSSE